MLATNFKLPTTKLCTVVWYRNGTKGEVLMPTPANNNQLVQIMFEHRVGRSEIRAVKPVDPTSLIGQKI